VRFAHVTITEWILSGAHTREGAAELVVLGLAAADRRAQRLGGPICTAVGRVPMLANDPGLEFARRGFSRAAHRDRRSRRD